MSECPERTNCLGLGFSAAARSSDSEKPRTQQAQGARFRSVQVRPTQMDAALVIDLLLVPVGIDGLRGVARNQAAGPDLPLDFAGQLVFVELLVRRNQGPVNRSDERALEDRSPGLTVHSPAGYDKARPCVRKRPARPDAPAAESSGRETYRA